MGGCPPFQRCYWVTGREDSLGKWARRTGEGTILLANVPAVACGFSLRCSSSRRTSTQAKNIRGAGGQPGQREPRRHNVDNEDNKAPRRARRARRAREAEGARQEHDGLEKQKQHGTSTSTSTSTNDSRICPQRAAMRVKSCCAAAPDLAS